MKGNYGLRFKTALGIGVTGLLLLTTSTNTSVATSTTCDACEREALKAYAEVLKLCQLADTENPRLRCYEAAKTVYIRTLEECRGGRK